MMRYLLISFAVLLALVSSPAPAREVVTAFIRTNVVPMDRERVLRDHTIIVAGGHIRAIGRGLEVPREARVIDGRGTAWLLPGLADLHVHIRSPDALAVMLASGITTALDMGEAPNSFVGRTRNAVARGEIPGPRVFAALAVDGSAQYGHLVVDTPDTARAAVRLAKANGYEFIKAYNGLSPEVFAALVAEGRATGLPVVGHGVESLGLERQILGGQVMVAHLEEFIYAFLKRPASADPLAEPDAADIPRAIEFLRRNGTTVTADLATFQAIAAQWGRPDVVTRYLQSPEVRHLAPADRMSWRTSGYARRSGSLAPRAAFLARFVKALAAAGIPLIAGTDAPTIPGLVTGHALHQNLEALEAAGLSRFQVLATATREPGAFLARARPGDARTGIVLEGARADLLLVAANPLEDLATLRRPLGVMANGNWHDAASLRSLLDRVEQLYDPSGGSEAEIRR